MRATWAVSKYFVSRYGYLYDDEGRLTDVSGQAGKSSNRVDLLHNTYNALGQRVRKDGHGVLTFAYDEAGHLLGEYTPGGVMVREYVWLGDRLVGMLSQDEADTVLQVHTDHLGTPRAVSQDNTVLWRWEGEAFGNSAPNEQVAGSARKFTLPLRFPGQYYDSETGLNYNYFRDYNSATGRYIESDPIGLRGGINPYAYVGGNPVSFADPYGLNPVAGAFVGGAIGGPPGALIGGLIGAGLGAWGGYEAAQWMHNRPYNGPPNGDYWPGPRDDGQFGNGRKYGPDGTPETDYDNDGKNHGNSWPDHPGGEHVHDWESDGKGGKKRGKPRPYCPI